MFYLKKNSKTLGNHHWIILGFSLLLISGCGEKQFMIDLDVVLEAFDKTSDSNYDLYTYNEVDSVASFIQYFSRYINDIYAEKYPHESEGSLLHPIKLNLLNDGSLEGYIDKNMDESKNNDERKEFLVEFYGDSAKVITTDTNNGYRRYHHYRRSSLGSTVVTAYFVNRMLNRQKAAGVDNSKFSNYKYSKKGYWSAAKSKKDNSARNSSSKKSTSRSGGSGK